MHKMNIDYGGFLGNYQGNHLLFTCIGPIGSTFNGWNNNTTSKF